MNKYYLLLAAPIFLMSCEGNTNREYNITNNSQDSLNLYIHNNYYDQLDSFVLAPQTSMEVLETNQRGGSDYSTDIGSTFTQFLIKNEAGDSCIKSHLIDANWTKEVIQVRKAPSQWEHDYEYVVNDSDF